MHVGEPGVQRIVKPMSANHPIPPGSQYILVGVCRSTSKKGGLRHGHNPKKGGARHGHEPKSGGGS